ncbi:MAG TPA: FAD-linked oxidase C-terminal domain-containing protein [Pyrinomonadaceae bacterium]|nr:FAD-linked oxidase C-terminal domain-containing protein [Pyrinomonadaceae bacterium]
MSTLIESLRAVVGRESVLSEPDELLVYECDGLTHYRAMPRAVVFPRTTEEVSEVVRVLARARVPFAPRGAGTGLSGGALALDAGVVVELARMRRLLKLDAENRLAVVEAGLVNAHLSKAAAPHGLHYAPDPSSQATCTVGGNIAENAGGIHCLKYGVTADHVSAARVVLSDGSVVDLTTTDDGAPLDLLGVFVGSEGTFGLATEATVKLTPLAPAVRTLLADFTDINDASRAVSDIIASGLVPAALEMVDGATIRAVEASVFAAGLPPDAEAALLIELDGLEAGLDEEAERAADICRRHGARGVRLAADEQERKKLWAARKGAFGAMGRITPDLMLQDAVVPRSRLPEVLAATYRIGERYGLRVANVFHAGDGNLHPYICYDARRAGEVERVHEAGREIMETCVRAGGTITGEHGVGLDKSAYLPLIFSADDLDTMRRLRLAFDPDGLCNPGKILPAPRGCGEGRNAATRRHADASRRDVDAGQRQDTSAVEPSGNAPINASPQVNVATPTRAGVTALLSSIVGEAYVGVACVGEAREVVSAEPASFDEACELLRFASREGLKVTPAGAYTWLDVGRPHERADILLRTTRLNRLVEHEPADLVATAEAGLTLAALNSSLARAAQWLPLDPPSDALSTLGGVAALGLSGAQSFGYGPPRSFVLGMKVALAGGRVVKAGGRVVKNVAGYDLCKLFTGSRGTLGLILELTLKLRPRPAREATLVAHAGDPSPLFEAARDLLSSNFLPAAVEMLSPAAARAVGAAADTRRHALLLRFAGSDRAVTHQLDAATSLLSARAGVSAVESREDDAPLWTDLAALALRATSPTTDDVSTTSTGITSLATTDEASPATPTAAAPTHARPAPLVWRARTLPTRLPALLEAASRLRLLTPETLWHAGLGDGRLRVAETSPPDASEQLAALRALREASGVGVHVALESAAPEVARGLDTSDSNDAASRLSRRIKNQLDPSDTFC